MKKYILAMTMLTATLSQAQVVISNHADPKPTNSSVLLEFGNNENKGIILPSVTSAPGAVAGTFIVNKTDKAVQYYNGTSWVNLTYPNTLVESTFVNDGTADVGDGVIIGAATSAKPGVLVLESTTKAMVLPRVADPHLNVLSPVAGTMVYDTTSDALAVYDGVEWSYWAASSAPTTPAPNNPVGTGSLSGRSCFDVVEQFVSDECGPLNSRLPQKANFAQTATNTQTYTFTPSGTVSNVRFVYVNTNGQVIQSLTGGNPGNNITGAVTATVKYYNNLNTTAKAKSRSEALTGDIYVIYNDGATNNGTDRQLKLTARVQDCACCGAMVSATEWKEFLCHNLGADTSLDPHVPVVGLQGAYIAWGRRGPNVTGDSRVDWQTAPNDGPNGFVAAPTAANANAGASIAHINVTDNYSWRTFADVKTANDPCPTGYHVPTYAEWTGVVNNNTLTRTGTWALGNTEYGSALHFGPSAGAKTLTLPAAGAHGTTGLGGRGYQGRYWSSTGYTGNSSFAYVLDFDSSNAYVPWGVEKAAAQSIRCIAD